jgi:transposase-like protein
MSEKSFVRRTMNCAPRSCVPNQTKGEDKMTKTRHLTEEERADIIARKSRGEKTITLAREYGRPRETIDITYNKSLGQCHASRKLASNRYSPKMEVIRSIERLSLADQEDIHRVLERRAPI